MSPSPPPAATPLAEHALSLPWLPDDRRYVLLNHTRMRASSARTDAYEIECDLGLLDAGPYSATRLSVWAPMEQLALLRPGTIFERRIVDGRVKALVERQATKLQATEMCVLSDEGPGAYFATDRRPLGSPPARLSRLHPLATVAEHAGRRIYVRSGELLRFYFGPISWLAEAFMSAAHSAPGAGLVDLEETGMVGPDVMQIAPVAGLTDRSSALHLAMLLSAPDLMGMWRDAAEGAVGTLGRGGEEGPLPPLLLAAGRHGLSLLGHTVPVNLDHYGERSERAFVAAAILSDFRPPPFRRLIIKAPYGADEMDMDDPDGEESDPLRRFRTVIAPGAVLESRRRPGIAMGKLAVHPESVRRAFPQLGRVDVTYDMARKVRRAGARQTQWRPRAVEALSATSPGSDVNVGGVVLRPGPLYRAAPTEPGPAPSQSLLDREGGELGRFEAFDRRKLAYPVWSTRA